MKIGIRAHDLGRCELEELFARIKSNSFDGIQLAIDKCLINLDYKKDNFIKIAQKAKEENIDIALLSAYFNPLHSNQDKVNIGIAKFKTLLSNGDIFNCKYVGTETGSYNDDKWTYNPLNHTKEAFQKVLDIFLELKKCAIEHQMYMAIEPAYNHAIYDLNVTKDLIKKLGFESTRITLDIYNLLNINNYNDYISIFESFLKEFMDKIVIIHLKDFIIEDEKLVQVSIGKGLIDFTKLFNIINRYNCRPYLIFEGVTGENIANSFTFIKNIINDNKI